MKLADLKRRLVPGTKLRLINSLMGPCSRLRVVAKTNTVDVMFTGDGIADGQVSHLAWPKSSALLETENGFKIIEDNMVCVEYEWVD